MNNQRLVTQRLLEEIKDNPRGVYTEHDGTFLCFESSLGVLSSHHQGGQQLDGTQMSYSSPLHDALMEAYLHVKLQRPKPAQVRQLWSFKATIPEIDLAQVFRDAQERSYNTLLITLPGHSVFALLQHTAEQKHVCSKVPCHPRVVRESEVYVNLAGRLDFKESYCLDHCWSVIYDPRVLPRCIEVIAEFRAYQEEQRRKLEEAKKSPVEVVVEVL